MRVLDEFLAEEGASPLYGTYKIRVVPVVPLEIAVVRLRQTASRVARGVVFSDSTRRVRHRVV